MFNLKNRMEIFVYFDLMLNFQLDEYFRLFYLKDLGRLIWVMKVY